MSSRTTIMLNPLATSAFRGLCSSRLSLAKLAGRMLAYRPSSFRILRSPCSGRTGPTPHFGPPTAPMLSACHHAGGLLARVALHQVRHDAAQPGYRGSECESPATYRARSHQPLCKSAECLPVRVRPSHLFPLRRKAWTLSRAGGTYALRWFRAPARLQR